MKLKLDRRTDKPTKTLSEVEDADYVTIDPSTGWHFLLSDQSNNRSRIFSLNKPLFLYYPYTCQEIYICVLFVHLELAVRSINSDIVGAHPLIHRLWYYSDFSTTVMGQRQHSMSTMASHHEQHCIPDLAVSGRRIQFMFTTQSCGDEHNATHDTQNLARQVTRDGTHSAMSTRRLCRYHSGQTISRRT